MVFVIYAGMCIDGVALCVFNVVFGRDAQYWPINRFYAIPNKCLYILFARMWHLIIAWRWRRRDISPCRYLAERHYVDGAACCSCITRHKLAVSGCTSEALEWHMAQRSRLIISWAEYVYIRKSCVVCVLCVFVPSNLVLSKDRQMLVVFVDDRQPLAFCQWWLGQTIMYRKRHGKEFDVQQRQQR